MLTINVPLSAGNISEDHTTTSTTEYLSLQHRLSQLSAAHSLCGQTISAKQNTILDYSNRLEQISRETAMTMDDLQKRAETAERELRWANEGRQSAEKRLRLAREELEVLRSNKVSRRRVSKLLFLRMSSSTPPVLVRPYRPLVLRTPPWSSELESLKNFGDRWNSTGE